MGLSFFMKTKNSNVFKMFRLLLSGVFLSLILGVQAAEFKLDGVTVHSSTSTQELECRDFSIQLIEEKFPIKYEMRIPKEFEIKGYYGGDIFVKREAYLMPEHKKIPLPNELEGIKSTLLQKRTYLPYQALCKGNSFVVFYGSGGNCNGCEVFIEFEVIEQEVQNPRRIDFFTLKQKYM